MTARSQFFSSDINRNVLSLFITMPHAWRILAFEPKTMPMARPLQTVEL